MALSRCINHPPRPTAQYVSCVEPFGYPNASSICGIANCNETGLIYLKKDEYLMYIENNQRIFNFATSATKVKVK